MKHLAHGERNADGRDRGKTPGLAPDEAPGFGLVGPRGKPLEEQHDPSLPTWEWPDARRARPLRARHSVMKRGEAPTLA